MHCRLTALLLVVLLVAPAWPSAIGTEAPCLDDETPLDTQIPQVVSRDGTPVVVTVRLPSCALEAYSEIRAWLGNATHQASRLHDGAQWTTSQHYTMIDGLQTANGQHLIPLQANPRSTHAPNLIENPDGTTAWMRLRGETGTHEAITLGSLKWVDEDRVQPYWGTPGQAWIGVHAGDELLGSSLQNIDKNDEPLPDGFAWVALPEGAPASPQPPVAVGDLLIVRFIPRLLEGGSLIELLVNGPINDLGGLRLESRAGHAVLAPLPVQGGDRVRITNNPMANVTPLQGQLDGHWSPPLVVTWDNDRTKADAHAGTKGRFEFARSGGSLHIVYGDHTLDSFAYGDAPAPDAWLGENTEATRIDGRVYLRAHDGDTLTDTDTAADWQRPRVHRQHQHDLPTKWFTVQGPVRAWVCPDRCHEEPLLRIEQAQHRIDANLYELTLPSAVQALAQAAERGVDVRVLVHDHPIGASSSRMDQVAWAVDRLTDAGASVRTLHGDRYDVNHAKYLIIDHAWTLVTTENAVQRGWPVDGQSGNRGHGVAVHDPALAEWTTQLFETDYNHPVDAYDITGTDLHPDAQRVTHPLQSLNPPPPATTDQVPTLVLDGGFPVAPVLAPDHLGDPRRNPIAETLAAAQGSIGLAQMNLPVHWSRPGHTQDSPLAEALLAAAERDVRVTGTLASAFIDDPARDGNHRTAAVLQNANDRIDLRLGGAPHPGGVVHAKTWWTDPGTPQAIAITGSANGNLASQAMNREFNLLLAHPDIARYWARIAEDDHAAAATFIDFAPERPPEDEPTPPTHEAPLPGTLAVLAILGAALAILALRTRSPQPGRY